MRLEARPSKEGRLGVRSGHHEAFGAARLPPPSDHVLEQRRRHRVALALLAIDMQAPHDAEFDQRLPRVVVRPRTLPHVARRAAHNCARGVASHADRVLEPLPRPFDEGSSSLRELLPGPAAGSWGSLLQVLGAKMAEDVRVGLCAVRRLEGDGARSRRGGITRLEFQQQHVPRPEAEPFVDAARLL